MASAATTVRPARRVLRQDTFRYLEAELRDYPETKAKLQEVVAEIIGGGMGIAYDVQAHRRDASPQWSDPTPARASSLAQHMLVGRMRAAISAVERLWERLPAEERKLMELYYWQRRLRGETAHTLGISEATLGRRRHAIVEALAEQMGLW